MKRIEYTRKDFAWTKWTVADVDTAASRTVAEKKAALAAVKRIPALERTFANTVAAIDASDRCFGELLKVSLLLNVSPDKDVRDAAQKAIERAEKQLVDLEYDRDVYRALKEYDSRRPIRGEKLTEVDRKLISDTLRDYRRRGFDLPEADQVRLKRNLKELSRLENAFQKNINDYRDSIEVDDAGLAGLPESYVKNLPRKNGKYVVTLDYPSYIPFMENAERDDLRRMLAEKNWRKGGKKNVKLLATIVGLREENAKLLGYATHADYRVENRMAGNAEAIFSFLGKLMTPLAKQVKTDVADLNSLNLEISEKGPSLNQGRSLTGELEVHEVAYLANRLKKERYAVDEEAVREYFPLPHVRGEMFALFGKLLGVSFERAPWSLWHKDAELYRIREAESGNLIAYFAFDLHPREGKYGHACMSNVISGHETAGGYATPFATIIANFNSPSKHRPALLSHDEVDTFFHEFGHLLHETLTEAKYVSQSGANVAWDFVEAMSQMCEFFNWEEKVLRKLSRHHVTGKPLPPALLRKLIASKRHLMAYEIMRQATQALYDMMVHTGNLRGTLPEYFRKLYEAHLGVRLPETSLFPAGFGHLAGGYDAGYYGYLWSRVYAADFFTKFREAGIVSSKTGASYRKEILSKGSSVEEKKIAKAFLGRKLSNKAFLADIGL